MKILFLCFSCKVIIIISHFIYNLIIRQFLKYNNKLHTKVYAVCIRVNLTYYYSLKTTTQHRPIHFVSWFTGLCDKT